MTYDSLDDFARRGKPTLANGPIAMVFAEDDTELASTLRHHRRCGFRSVLCFVSPLWDTPPDLEGKIHRITCDPAADGAVVQAVNRINDLAAGQWLYYCYNAEYLFYPFCETRTVGEMLAFHSEERRDAMLSYVIDLYAADLARTPSAVSLEDAHLDRSGYYALARPDPKNHNHPRDRQLDFFGGLRWRYEEHIPPERRKIDRIALFRARPGQRLREDHTFDVEENNTYACPWHNNLTAAIASFRTAKALKRNPGSTSDIRSFHWRNSMPFEWHSRQLLDLGLMEPGQWF
ncbi:hypothetical protein [Sagittula salina]|uniref:Uncharacterized protein n=1 Tax=Sagittula salina TaxID=2820268 RepID=A0A940S1Z9_9RHOB|nr:hypothetical protein [Sagittula salina]MBP0483606.1 hypothetical protein [Sagittula salina]